MLKSGITIEDIKKILSTKSLKTDYLNRVAIATQKNIPYGKSANSINEAIITTWDYTISKKIIREMFTETQKYKEAANCHKKIDLAIQDWHNTDLGPFEWPFSAMNFDKRVVAINRMEISEKQKDALLSYEVIKFRRIKDINTMRNDYIEYLIISQNDNIIPTLTHRNGVDFYIDGKPYDQKVSKSVGKEFINTYGNNYRDIAIKHPELVAKSLYEHQDGERFDDQPRLYIVYLDDNISNQQIEKLLSNINFTEPYTIEFDYYHAHVLEHHQTHCFIILLYN